MSDNPDMQGSDSESHDIIFNLQIDEYALPQKDGNLRQWQKIFGTGFTAMFLFMYLWPDRPETSPMKEMFLHHDHWQGTPGITVANYRECMKPRPHAWGTVHLPAKDFRRLAKPFEEWL